MHRRIVLGLFVALLLASQVALSAHDADIDAHAGDESCAVCLLSNGLDNTAPLPVHAFSPDIARSTATTGLKLRRVDSRFQTAYRSRAPPLHHAIIQ